MSRKDFDTKMGMNERAKLRDEILTIRSEITLYWRDQFIEDKNKVLDRLTKIEDFLLSQRTGFE